MLQHLSGRVRLCYERAEEARAQAEATLEPETKAHFLRMEKRWLLLARSNDFGERLDRFLHALPTKTRSHAFDPHSMLGATSAAVFAKDVKSRMMVANPACLSLLGKSWSEVGGRNDVEWHTDRVQARQVLSNDQLVIESEQSHVYEEPFDTSLGPRIILSTKAPLLDRNGEVVGIVGVAKDITERKRNEEAAQFLRQEMAHRLKNCISLVQAMARQSIKAGDDLSRFEGRLHAYGQSQELIGQHDSVPLHA